MKWWYFGYYTRVPSINLNLILYYIDLKIYYIQHNNYNLIETLLSQTIWKWPFVQFKTLPVSFSEWFLTIRCHISWMQTRTLKCNCDFQFSIRHSWQTKMETLIWFQARWVCLFLSQSIRLYICLPLPHFNHPCPSRLCLVHWSMVLTLPGFGCLIPVCSVDL